LTAAAAAAATAAGERGQGSRKFEQTPDFVAGGALHPYQLEGLNWLYHKAQVSRV
jgi:SNF2 family DNA or RNA helicase